MNTLDAIQTMTVDRTSSTPLYSQVKAILRGLIEEGMFREGDFIPTERELGHHFQVSRITVRRAIDELAREGYLDSQQGRGTLVAQSKIGRPITQLESFSATTISQGYQPGSQLLSLRHERADEDMADLLNLEPGDWIWVVERLRLADDEPIGISQIYLNLPPTISLTPLELHQETSLWALLEHKGIVLTTADETVQAVPATAQQAQLLNTEPGFSLLLVEGVVYSENKTPIEYHRIFNRGDRYKYSVTAVR